MEFFRAVAFLLAAASALAAVGALGGAISDRLDVLAQAAPVWLTMGLAALVLQAVTGLSGGRATLVLGAVAVAVPLALMAPDLLARVRARPAAPAGQRLRLVQLNVWDLNFDGAGTARWIAGQDADVVVLEEAALKGARVAEALAPAYPHRVPCPDLACATLILSKAAPSASGLITWPGLSFRHAGAWASFGEGPGAFTVVGTHFRWPIPAGPQRDQAQRLAAFLKRFDASSLILAGDFNATPTSFVLRRQDAGLGLIRRTRALATWPAGGITHFRLSAPFPILAIDHVYAGPGWRTVSVARGPRLGSDHYPVVVELTR